MHCGRHVNIEHLASMQSGSKTASITKAWSQTETLDIDLGMFSEVILMLSLRPNYTKIGDGRSTAKPTQVHLAPRHASELGAEGPDGWLT